MQEELELQAELDENNFEIRSAEARRKSWKEIFGGEI